MVDSIIQDGVASQTRLALNEDKHFDFFELPRELRDGIYDGLTEDYALGRPHECLCPAAHMKPNPEVNLTGGPKPALLVLNRQFEHEYKEWVRRSALLIYRDISHCFTSTKLTGSLKDVSKFECHLTVYTGMESATTHADEAASHVQMLQSALEATLEQVNKIQTLTVNVYVVMVSKATEADWLVLLQNSDFSFGLKELIDAVAPTKIALFTILGRHWEQIPDEDRRLRRTWTEGGGWIDAAST